MSSLQCEGGRGWPCTSTAIHNTSEQQAMWVCLFDHCGRGHVMAVRHAAPGFSSERGPGEGQQGMSRMARTRGNRPATASAGVLLLLCSAALIGGAASWSPGNSGIGRGSHPCHIHPHPRPFMEAAEKAKLGGRVGPRAGSAPPFFLLVLSPGGRFSPIPPLYCRICPSSLLCV